MLNKSIALAPKSAYISALRAFVAQRSGIDYTNYGERSSFMGDYREILKSGRDARKLIREIEWRESITAQDIVDASHRAFSGRLQFVEREKDGKMQVAVNYYAGQYFATEYRNAACAVCASVLWGHWGKGVALDRANEIRKAARVNLGKGIASRWFS